MNNAHTAEVIQPTGTLQIWIDGVELTGPFTLPGGMVPIEIEQTFSAGNHRIDATYSGDDTYEAKTAFLELTAVDEEAEPLATEIAEFTLSPSSPPATPAGGTVTATVRVAVPSSAVVPTGSVSMSFYGEGDPFDTQPLVAGVATFTTVLPPGANDLVARYLPAAGFVASSLDATHYVGSSPSTTTIEADPSTSSVGPERDTHGSRHPHVRPGGDGRREVRSAPRDRACGRPRFRNVDRGRRDSRHDRSAPWGRRTRREL